MLPNSKIFVAGHRGLAGSAITESLRSDGYRNLLLRRRTELDLTDAAATRSFFEHERPEYVVLAAAKVGGILANDTYPAEFIHQNLLIQSHVIHESWRAGVKRLLFLGSSCIYPRDCPQPIREEYLLTGPLENTNRAYALAKIAGVEMCASYNRQYGTEFVCVMPTNLFGRGDNYDLATSHVLPALIRKAHEAKELSSKEMIVWGSGQVRREFLYSDDLGHACSMLLAAEWEHLRHALPSDRLPLLNVGAGKDSTIAELVNLICAVVGFDGSIRWDKSKPDGTPRKLLDSSRIASLGWSAQTPFEHGIKVAYEDYLRHLDTSRECHNPTDL